MKTEIITLCKTRMSLPASTSQEVYCKAVLSLLSGEVLETRLYCQWDIQQPERRRHKHACTVRRMLLKECCPFMRNEPRVGGVGLLEAAINRSRAGGSLWCTYSFLELCFLILRNQKWGPSRWFWLSYTLLIRVLFNSSEAINEVVVWINTVNILYQYAGQCKILSNKKRVISAS